jgi:hypothetical protein
MMGEKVCLMCRTKYRFLDNSDIYENVRGPGTPQCDCIEMRDGLLGAAAITRALEMCLPDGGEIAARDVVSLAEDIVAEVRRRDREA